MDDMPPAKKIKTEPVDAADLESRIIHLCEENDGKITNNLLKGALPDFPPEELAKAINQLMHQGRLDVFKKGKSNLLYRLKDLDVAKKVKNFTPEEKVVYKLISDSGDKGIWHREIRTKSNIPAAVLTKVLKSLETSKHIKGVKSVTANKRKQYMLYDLEPAESITGGAWYCDQEFESEFVEVLNKQCFKFLEESKAAAENKGEDPITCRNASYKSTKDVWKYINDLKVSRVQLSEENIEGILNTLIADEKVEKMVVAEGSCSSGQQTTRNMYRAVAPIVTNSALLRMPCGVCRVYKDCHEGGIISPSTCSYMKEWFDY